MERFVSILNDITSLPPCNGFRQPKMIIFFIEHVQFPKWQCIFHLSMCSFLSGNVFFYIVYYVQNSFNVVFPPLIMRICLIMFEDHLKLFGSQHQCSSLNPTFFQILYISGIFLQFFISTLEGSCQLSYDLVLVCTSIFSTHALA